MLTPVINKRTSLVSHYFRLWHYQKNEQRLLHFFVFRSGDFLCLFLDNFDTDDRVCHPNLIRKKVEISKSNTGNRSAILVQNTGRLNDHRIHWTKNLDCRFQVDAIQSDGGLIFIYWFNFCMYCLIWTWILLYYTLWAVLKKEYVV